MRDKSTVKIELNGAGVGSATVDDLDISSSVTVDEATVEALVALGWIPPGSEFAISWHPVTAGWTEPIEVPLNEHIAWCPEELGEFKLEVREVPQSAGEAPEVSGA